MTVMEVMNRKVLTCLCEGKFVDIGLLIPAILPKLIVEAAKVVDIGLKRPANLPQIIAEVMDVGQV